MHTEDHTRISPPLGGHVGSQPTDDELGFSLDQRFRWLCQGSAARSFAEMDGGSLLNLSNADGGTVRTSRDGGQSWEVVGTMYEGEGPGRPTLDLECGTALRTENGVIVWLYRDHENKQWQWDDEKGAPAGEARLDVWAIRSLDGGKTWVDRQLVFEGWCGCINDIILTRDGHIVVPIQRLLLDPPRHAQCTYVSQDDGKNWTRSNVIDLGGYGHHDGNCEGSIIELSDGRLFMLLRTAWERFWAAHSWDGGLSWRQVQPTDTPASSAPGYLERLASGRVVLVWNRLKPGAEPRPLCELKPDPNRPRTDWGSEIGRSELWSREELSIAYSDDEGETWSEPQVLVKGNRVCYPQIWERSPGTLWISFVAGKDWTKNLVAVREELMRKT